VVDAHADPEHSGRARSPINSRNVHTLALLHELSLDGPVLSTPAVVGGYVYVGCANSKKAIAILGDRAPRLGLVLGGAGLFTLVFAG
jgi:hypothetical protein